MRHKILWFIRITDPQDEKKYHKNSSILLGLLVEISCLYVNSGAIARNCLFIHADADETENHFFATVLQTSHWRNSII